MRLIIAAAIFIGKCVRSNFSGDMSQETIQQTSHMYARRSFAMAKIFVEESNRYE